MKKSPGPDDIRTERLVAAGYVGMTELTKLANYDVRSHDEKKWKHLKLGYTEQC